MGVSKYMRGTTMMLRLSSVFAIACAAVFMCSEADAAGFYLQEQSTSNQGAAFAGAAANPQDASTLFYNPAGITSLGDSSVSADVSVIAPTLHFKNTGSTAVSAGGPPAAVYAGNNGGNPFKPTPVPSFYGVHPIEGGKYWLGLSVTSPFGLDNDYNSGWFGRYDSTESSLKTVNVSPVFAMKLGDRFSVGGGPNFQYVDARLDNALPCPSTICGPGAFTTATDGKSRLEGDAWTVGYNLGALYKVTDKTQVGASYRSAMTQHINDGVVTVSGLLGPLAAGNGTQHATADLSLPDTFSLGVQHQATDQLSLLASYNWFGWNNFNAIRVNFTGPQPTSVTPENYDNSYSVALGAQWKQNDNWTFRGGLQYDQTPTTLPDRSTRTPDSDRYWLSAGATYLLGNNMLVDFAASHLFMKDGQVGLTKNFYTGTGADTTVNVTGKTTSHVDILSFQATWKF